MGGQKSPHLLYEVREAAAPQDLVSDTGGAAAADQQVEQVGMGADCLRVLQALEAGVLQGCLQRGLFGLLRGVKGDLEVREAHARAIQHDRAGRMQVLKQVHPAALRQRLERTGGQLASGGAWRERMRWVRTPLRPSSLVGGGSFATYFTLVP